MRSSEDSPELIRLLRSREALGLRVPAIGRMVFLTIALAVVAFSIRADEVGRYGTPIDVLVTAGLSFMLLLNVFIYYQLRRESRVATIGLVGAGFDALFVIFLSTMAQVVGVNDGLAPGFVYKSELPVAVMTVIVINGLALRPRYPAIVGVGALVALVVPAFRIGWGEPGQVSVSRIDVYTGSAVDPGQVAVVLAGTIGTTLAVVFFTRAARQTLRKGISQEIEQARLRQDQLRVVMQEKVRTLRKLVAGVCHEVNTPIGAVKSSTDTLGRVLDRLDTAKDDKAKARFVAVGRESLGTIETAVTRISALEASLRSLSHLDEGDLQNVDLNAELDRVVAAVRRSLGDEVNVVTHYGDLPELVLNGSQINQALLTVVTNAFEAAGTAGTVTLRTHLEEQQVRIEIEDDGPGIEAQRIPELFDVSLASKGERMGAGLGLAVAQNMAHLHGGALTARSTLGRGATFVFSFPASTSSEG